MSLSLPIPIPSITPPPEPSDPIPEPSSTPPSSVPSSAGPSSGGPSSGGPSSGGPSSGGPSSSGGGGSSSAPPSSSSEPESSSETTLSQDSTSVFSSTSVIVTDGSTITTVMPITTVIESGSVVTNPSTATASGAPVGAIVGGVIGGLVGLLALGALIFFFMKRRKHNFDKEFDGNFDPDYVSKHNTGSNVFTTGLGGAAAAGAAASTSHRKSQSLEKAGGRQRVNLNNGMDRASLEAAALAEDDGMGGRLDASTVGGGIVTPFPYPQGQAPPQGYAQQPYNPAMSPPPGGHMALGAAGAAGAGYYAGHHQGQQPYGYGQQPYGGGQGYPDRLNGAISPISSDGTHSYPNSANPYLSGAPASSQGHSNAYGGYADPSNQSVYGGVAPSVTGTSVSGYPPPQGFGGVGTFGAAGAVMSSGASTHSSAGTGPAGALSYTTGSGGAGMSAKEREARGLNRPGMAVANPDERPENRRAEGSAGSVLPSPFDAALGSSSAAAPRPSGKAAEANVGNRQSGVVVHTDGGRVDEEESAPGEIPPAYDSLLYERK